jgi:hypothetical protein
VSPALLACRRADGTPQQLLAGAEGDHTGPDLQERIAGQAYALAPSDRDVFQASAGTSSGEASLWEGGAGMPGGGAIGHSSGGDGGGFGSEAGIEEARLQVERVERELSRAREDVQEMQARVRSQTGAREASCAGAAPPGRGAPLYDDVLAPALRSLEARVSALESERMAAAAQLDFAKALQERGVQGGGTGSGAFSAPGDPASMPNGGLLASERGNLSDLAGALSRLEAEVTEALGERGPGGGDASEGGSVKERLHTLALAVHRRLMAAGARVRDARAAAAAADARAAALAARLRRAGLPDELDSLPSNPGHACASTDGAEWHAELAEARAEVLRLQAALQELQARCSSQEAGLAALRAAGSAAGVASGGLHLATDTSSASTPLISAWTPTSARAGGPSSPEGVGSNGLPGSRSRSTLSAGGAALAVELSAVGASSSAAALLAATLSPEASAERVSAAARPGSLSPSVRGRSSSGGGAAAEPSRKAGLQLRSPSPQAAYPSGGGSARGSSLPGGSSSRGALCEAHGANGAAWSREPSALHFRQSSPSAPVLRSHSGVDGSTASCEQAPDVSGDAGAAARRSRTSRRTSSRSDRTPSPGGSFMGIALQALEGPDARAAADAPLCAPACDVLLLRMHACMRCVVTRVCVLQDPIASMAG